MGRLLERDHSQGHFQECVRVQERVRVRGKLWVVTFQLLEHSG